MSDAREPAAVGSEIELVVRRGALRRFRALKEKTAHLPVKVVWDRRQDDRRRAQGNPSTASQNRRAGDRRQKPPLTWELAEFVVVAPDSEL